jgi:hypothetical protein
LTLQEQSSRTNFVRVELGNENFKAWSDCSETISSKVATSDLFSKQFKEAKSLELKMKMEK